MYNSRMKNDERLESEIQKQYREKDRRKRKRMKVSGKSVFTLQKLAQQHVSKKLLRPRRRAS